MKASQEYECRPKYIVGAPKTKESRSRVDDLLSVIKKLGIMHEIRHTRSDLMVVFYPESVAQYHGMWRECEKLWTKTKA